MGTKCIDCGGPRKNRSKSCTRCRACRLAYIAKNKTGRVLPTCSICGGKLSAKANTTGKCKKCFKIAPWNKGAKLPPSWNKGNSIYASPEDARDQLNKRRKIARDGMTKDQLFPDRIRTLIRNQIRRYCERKKDTKTEEYLGCNANYFRDYIQSLFQNGMSWENYGNKLGQWNIDHIIPVSSFDLNDKEQARTAFNYKNCRPLWAVENMRKGAKLP